jgi:hypothetical protein
MRDNHMPRARFKIVAIELQEVPSEAGQYKLMVTFQMDPGQNVFSFGSSIPGATHTVHILNPEPRVLQGFIEGFYAKKLFNCDFSEDG